MNTREMPRKFWNLLYENGVNPNNFIFIDSDADSFRIKSKKDR